MKTLREQMDDAMVLRRFAPRTRESYLAAVTALAKHYWRKPDLLTPEEVQAWLLHLIVERKLAYSSVNQMNCACRFLYEKVLRRPEIRFDIPMAKVPTILPRVLSRDEVTRVFAAASNPRARTLLITTYAAGLRVSEVCALQLVAANLARLLARVSPAHLAVSKPIRHGSDRCQSGATHVLCGARQSRPWPCGRHPHPAPLLRHPFA